MNVQLIVTRAAFDSGKFNVEMTVDRVVDVDQRLQVVRDDATACRPSRDRIPL
jgi:hypothetical protein